MHRRNPILSSDSYKASHWLQYPPGTNAMHSYIEARSKVPGNNFSVFFGLQACLHEYFTNPITTMDVLEAESIFRAHGEPFNTSGWLDIVNRHGGMFPVIIRAVPEGTVVPNGNVLVTVESTDPDLFWVASYVETLLLRGVWYPTTVATRSYQCKQVIKEWLQRTNASMEGLPFKLHDFGARGVSSGESAMLGGMGHLVNFMGTDTVEALVGARRYYNTDMAGFSIPAAEHSTITSWGKDHEADAYANMLQMYGGYGKVLAVVSDSYDLKNAVGKIWGGELKAAVINSGATVVIRPDSGDPATNVSAVARILDEKFGSTMVGGFKLLNNVRIIQGDGIDSPLVIDGILRLLASHGFSADNVAFGMGGGLLQHVNRDTLGFAMKCSAVRVGNEWRDVFKEAPGKESKRGRLDLLRIPGGFETSKLPGSWEDGKVSAMQTVYNKTTDYIRLEDTLDNIRNRAA